MAVIRVNKTKDYTVMGNYHFKEKTMSLKAKGLLSLMLSLPDDWDYSINGLVAICKENERAIKSSLEELRMYGYLVVTKKMPNQTQSGRIEYEYDIYEKPHKKQGVQKQPVEIQAVENAGQLNTNISNTKELNNNVQIDSFFNDIWLLYPKKKGKGQISNSKKKELYKLGFETVKKCIERYVSEHKDTDIKYIQNGSTFFNSGYIDYLDENYTPLQKPKGTEWGVGVGY